MAPWATATSSRTARDCPAVRCFYWHYPGTTGAHGRALESPRPTEITFLRVGRAGGETVKFIAGGMTGMATSHAQRECVRIAHHDVPRRNLIDLTTNLRPLSRRFRMDHPSADGPARSLSFTVDMHSPGAVIQPAISRAAGLRLADGTRKLSSPATTSRRRPA